MIKLALPFPPSVWDIIQFLNYNPDTGIFTWKERRVLRPHDAQWNKRFAGRTAGYVNSTGYVMITLYGRSLHAHRVAWLISFGEWPELDIDHIGGRKANNCIHNLRLATDQQNGGNRARPKNNTSGVKGVRFESGKWRAQIRENGRNKHLGLYGSKEEAAAAYLSAAHQIFGEFAYSGEGR